MSIHLAFFDPFEGLAALAVLFTGAVAFVMTTLTAVVHVVSAIAVYRDGKALEHRQPSAVGESSHTILVPPEVWAAATLVLGILMLAAYWILHHTTFFERRVRTLAGDRPGTSAADAAPVG